MSRAEPSLFAPRDLPETAPVDSHDGPVEVRVTIKDERPLALQVYQRGKLVWLQKSQVTIVDRNAARGREVTLAMSRAYRTEKGLT